MTTPPSVLSMSTTSSRSLFLPSPHPFRRPHPRKTPFSSLTPHASSSHHHQSDSPDDKDRTTTSPLNDDLLRLTPATLTVLSTSLAAAAPAFAAKSPVAKDDKRKRPSSSKRPPPQALSPEELQQWTRDLPDVSDRIPYTDLLRLREEGLLKHIVKPRSLNTKHRPSDAVLAILRDSRVLRAVLPPAERDPWFWDSWDSLRMDDLCMNAYTPALKSLFPSPYLGFISKLPYSFIFSLDFFLSSLLDLFLKYQWWKPKPLSKRELEFERLKARMEAAREAEMERIRTEREIVERALEAERRMEERRRREEARTMRMERFQEDLEQAKFKSKVMRGLWTTLAKDTAVSTTVAWMIFGLFYWVVVYNYRRSKKDYEDRMKIQQVEREDRKKMRELLMEEQEEWNRGGGEEGDDQQDYLKMAQNFMRSGARVRRARGKRLPKYMDMQNDVRFSDCAGLGKIRYELEEVVKFFTHGEVYQRRGIKTPGGILLCGPPGVGKTLLAKAVAGEAGVNFLSISASQFVEIYVGVGASRVRALYEEAKQNAPSVVFIDELDAVGRTRGLIEGSGGQERDATLNQLLVCLDGFEGRGDVVTIAATNRPDILDPALVRPGRFDRKIVIPRPGFIGRLEILKVHAQNKPIAEDIDYDEIASKTEGMVGAELANVVEMAAIRMMRDGRSEIITDDILQAIQVEDRGLLEKKVRNLDMWKRIALLEGSLAVAAVNFPELNSVEFITISPRSGRELGYARLKRDRMKFWTGMLSRQYLLDYITVQLAPRAADAIWYGEDTLSTIWAQAADNARSAARSFVFRGLSEKYYGLSQFWSVDRHDEIDLEAMRILDACYARAREILQRNRVLLDAVVDRLVEKKSLTKQEFFHLVNEYGQLEALPPSLVDIRREKLAEFREMTMSQKSQ